jgi:ATPase subunit of ABC transporter with duplicated ATPase domains
VGTTVKLAYVDQSRADLDPTKNVWEEISGGQEQIPLGDRLVNSRAYVARFNLADLTSRRKSARSPVASAIVSIWPRC